MIVNLKRLSFRLKYIMFKLRMFSQGIFFILLIIIVQGNVEICERNSVCSIIHNRFWLPNKHEKICKCPGKPCPVVYTQEGNFLHINTRSQMQFCEPLSSNLMPCDATSVALSITQRMLPNLQLQQNIELLCKCQGHKYWKYYSHIEKYNEDEKIIIDNFSCMDLRKCAPNQFCGFARTDYGFVYHRCTCPMHYKCIFDPGTQEIFNGVQELFYNATAYEAHCRLMNENDLW